jgi:single-stranded DNA-binding protein
MSAKIFGTVCGYVSNEVKEEQTPKGTPYVSFSMAMTKKVDGDQNAVTAWVKAQMFGQSLMEFVKKTVRKGSYVAVHGEIKVRSYLQKKDNTPMAAVDVNATAIDVPKMGQSSGTPDGGTTPF